MTVETLRMAEEIAVIGSNASGGSGGAGLRSSVSLHRTRVSVDDDPLLTMIAKPDEAAGGGAIPYDDAKKKKIDHRPAEMEEGPLPVIAFDPDEYSYRSPAMPTGRRPTSRPAPDAIAPLKGGDDDDYDAIPPPRAGFADLKPPGVPPCRSSSGGSLRRQRSVSGGGGGSCSRKSVRHEALEELAASVRDLRAEVHGRPSLSERRFSALRRSRSCNNLMAEIGGMLDALMEEESDDEAEGAAKEGRKDSGKRESIASFGSNGPLGGARRSSGFLGGGLSSSRRRSRSSLIVVTSNDSDPKSPHDAAVRTIESVYSLVSALYGLVDSRQVPSDVASAILHHTPSIDLAFGRIKPLIMTLAFESDFDESGCIGSTHSGSSGGDSEAPMAPEEEEDEDSAELRRQLSDVSRLLDAMAETVRHIAEVAASLQTSLDDDIEDSSRDGEPPSPKTKKMISKASSPNHDEKAVDEAECAYVTFLELLGLKCSELSRSDAAGACLSSMDYMMADFGHASFGSSSGLLFGNRSAGFLDFDESVDVNGGGDSFSPEDGKEEWELGRSVRASWMSAGHGDKVRILERHRNSGSRATRTDAGEAKGRDRQNGSDDGRNKHGARVDPDLLREMSLLVLGRMEWRPRGWKAAIDLAQDRTLLQRMKDAAGEGKSVGVESAMTLCRLGDVKVATKEFDNALAHFDEALRITRESNGYGGPSVAAILEAIGDVHRLEQRYDDAESRFREALSAIEKGGGGRSSSKGGGGGSRRRSTESLLSLLLSWYRLKSDMGEMGEALAMLERRLAVQRECPALGPDHPETAGTLFRQGTLCMDGGMDEEAERAFSEALRIRRAAFGPDDPSVADALFALGLLKCTPAQSAAGTEEKEERPQQQGTAKGGGAVPHRIDEALDHLWDALRIRRQEGADPLQQAETLALLGKIHRMCGELETAAGLYGECLDLRVETQGKDHQKVADVHVALGYVHGEMKERDESLRNFKAALSIMENVFGESDARVIKLARLIGNAEFAAGDLPSAKMHLERFVRLKRQTGDDQGLDCVEALHALGKICHATGEFDEARRAYTGAQTIYAVNNHAVQRMTTGKELIESLRNLDAACRGEPTIDDGAGGPMGGSGAEEEASNPVRSFIMKVGRSISMEQVTAREYALHRASSTRVTHSDGKGRMLSSGRSQSMSMTSQVRKSSLDASPSSHRSGSLDNIRNRSAGNGRTGSMAHGRKSSLEHARSVSMGHGSRNLSTGSNSSSLGSSILFGRKQSMGHAPRNTSINLSSSPLSGGGTGRKWSMDEDSRSSSMDHNLSSSCQAIASGQKLSSATGSSQPVMAQDHLWASQIDFNVEDLPGVIPNNCEEDRNSLDKKPADIGSGEDRPPRGSSGRSSSPSQPNLDRNPSIITAMRAAHTSVRNTFTAIRDEAVQQK